MDPDKPSSPGRQRPTARHAQERRAVTTLFCDLVGFTALSERNDPELVDGFLRRYHAVAREAIEAYGGTVEKFIGDAVVAVFGVPVLHEDDPERAVRAGLRLVDEVDALPGVGGRAVEVRLGINTGEALVRLEVDPAFGEGFLVGDAVNVAARLQTAAPPMAVAVGEATHAATEKVFTFEPCHPVDLKGKARPLAAWIATEPRARTGSELRSFASEFVGREEELDALRAMLDEAARTQRPRFALISGAPGIGKTRLLAEFARRLDDRPETVAWHQGRCLPFGANVTFWALSEIVRDVAGVLEADGVARTEARLEATLPDGPERRRLRSRLRPLLGLVADEASREENFEAWRRFLESLASARPVVLAVDDLHWADEAMLAFMDYLAQSGSDVPLLVLASARPEVAEAAGPGAGFVAAAAHVPLGPLSGEETAYSPGHAWEPSPCPRTSRRSSSSAVAATRSSPRTGEAAPGSRPSRDPRGQGRAQAGCRGPSAGLDRRADRRAPRTPAARSAKRCSPTPPSSDAASGPERSQRLDLTKSPRSSRASTTWSPKSSSARSGIPRSRARRSSRSSTPWSARWLTPS